MQAWGYEPYRVEVDFGQDLQLLIQVLAVGPHPLAELEAALDVGGVDEVLHVQDVLLPARSERLARPQQLPNATSVSR